MSPKTMPMAANESAAVCLGVNRIAWCEWCDSEVGAALSCIAGNPKGERFYIELRCVSFFRQLKRKYAYESQ